MNSKMPAAGGRDIARAMFRLKRPCGGCPFTADGVDLEPGRLQSIVADLLANDHQIFHCHETVYSKRLGGQFSDAGDYTPSHRGSVCAGAMVVLEELNRPSVAQRVGAALGVYDRQEVMKNAHLVVRPCLDQMRGKK